MGRTITCPDCGLTWTCPDYCYPGCHAVDEEYDGAVEYCRKCGNIRAGIRYTKKELAHLKNWHELDTPSNITCSGLAAGPTKDIVIKLDFLSVIGAESQPSANR